MRFPSASIACTFFQFQFALMELHDFGGAKFKEIHWNSEITPNNSFWFSNFFQLADQDKNRDSSSVDY